VARLEWQVQLTFDSFCCPFFRKCRGESFKGNSKSSSAWSIVAYQKRAMQLLEMNYRG
jgi:hypothetical protein